MRTAALIQYLEQQVEEIKTDTAQFLNLELEQLNFREAENSWSVLECLEHLNLYGDYYLPAIQSKLNNIHSEKDTDFKSSWLGNYFAQSMLPKEKLNKMKTFKDKNPLNSKLDKTTINKFKQQLTKLEELIVLSKSKNLSKIKIPTSISKIIKMNVGDTFRFYMNHIQRHIKQMERIQLALQQTQSK